MDTKVCVYVCVRACVRANVCGCVGVCRCGGVGVCTYCSYLYDYVRCQERALTGEQEGSFSF